MINDKVISKIGDTEKEILSFDVFPELYFLEDLEIVGI